MHSPGLVAFDDGAPVDFAALRRERFDRCLDEMARQGIDALVLGRESNARYVSGARRLFTTGTRPFAPGCVVVAATRAVRLLSTWDDGIPAEIPHANLVGLSWNPENTFATLAKTPGLLDARRVGVDGMTFGMEARLRALLPNAELVDGEHVLRAVRSVKTARELDCLRIAAALAEACLAAAANALRPGVSERTLLGAFESRMASLGITTPAQEGTFCVLPAAASGAGSPLRRLTSDRPIEEDDLVACAGGVLYAGYEGSIGRTIPCLGPGRERRPAWRSLAARHETLRTSLAAALRPGATGADLRAAYEAAGEPLPPLPIARGIGLGYEPPVIGTNLGAEADAAWTLTPEMTLLVTSFVSEPGTGGWFEQDMVLITDDGHEVLTRTPWEA